MSDDADDLGNARDTRDLVLGEALKLAGRAIEHVDAHEGVAHVTLDSTIPAGGHSWHITAGYGHEHSFVGVSGHPVYGEPGEMRIYTEEQMVRVMGNQQASFSVNVPRQWVEAALRAPIEIPVG